MLQSIIKIYFHYRHALEDALERAFVPGLAAVVSFLDVRANLQLIDSNSPFKPLWMKIFSQADKLGLKFSLLTRQNEIGSQAVSSLVVLIILYMY